MKIYRVIFCSLFFLILAVPLVGMLWYKEPESTENKTLAQMPKLVEEKTINYKYLSDLEAYLSDHFAYRQELVTADAVLMSRVFHQSSENLAIVGTDGWLYLRTTLDDYQGTNRMSDRGIRNVATVVSLMQEYVEGMGKTFVFTSAPNKNTLYPAYMPYYYTQTDKTTNLQRVSMVMQELGCNYVDLYALFEAQTGVLYHKGDSHWDNRGAALVQDALLEQAGVEHTDLTQVEPQERDDFQGDIDKILYPLARHPEKEYDYSPYFTYSYDGTDDVTANVVTTTGTKGDGSRLLCFRDSFGNSLLPFLAQEFDFAKFGKAVPYRIDAMYTENRDVCIVELVERNLVNLVKFAPVMPAPLRAFSEDTRSYSSETVTSTVSEFDGYYKIQGFADETYVDTDSPIYLRFTGESGCFVIEAAPADELTTGTPSDYGFTAYIGKQAFPAGEYQMEMITEHDGSYYSVQLDNICFN